MPYRRWLSTGCGAEKGSGSAEFTTVEHVPIDTLEPIPGDPDAVAAAARNLQAVAAEVEATSARLRALATRHDFWTGRAAVRAHARSLTLPPKLAKVHDSYATAGGALRRYATVLSEAQAASIAARRAASRADDDLRYARAAYTMAATRDAEATRAAAGSGLPAPVPTAVRYERDISDAEGQLRRAAAANAAAHDQHRRAAHAAAMALHQAAREGMHNQPWWRRALSTSAHWAAQAWTDSLRHIAKAALTISAMAGLAAMAVTLAGMAFPPLEAAAGVLESISIASGVVALMSEAMLAATGKSSWKSVAVDSLVAVPAVGNVAARLGISATRRGARVDSAADRFRRGAAPQPRAKVANDGAPPLRLRAAESWRDITTLEDHVLRHGADFGVTSSEEYANVASDFLQNALIRQVPVKISERNGTIRIYDPVTNTFGSYGPEGMTKTLYKPDPAQHHAGSNWAYWLRQAGKEPWNGDK